LTVQQTVFPKSEYTRKCFCNHKILTTSF